MGNQDSYFRGIRIKLSISVFVGSLILILYYWKLFDLTHDQLLLVIGFLLPVLFVCLLLPVPINRRLLDPVIQYLRGTGLPDPAEHAAASFPLRSALMSLLSWILGGFVCSYYSARVFDFSRSFLNYIYMAMVSAGFASSFVHFHLMRSAMVPIRIRIAQETSRDFTEMRYPILTKLLTSFTLLIWMSSMFIALMDNAHIEQALVQQTQKLIQEQVTHWSVLLSHDPSLVRHLPDGFTVESMMPRPESSMIVAGAKLGNGGYLVSRIPRSSYDFVLNPVQWEATSIILIVVLVGAVVSYFAASDISRPLNLIREKTRQIAQGDFSHIVNVITDDEVSELAQSINRMTEELRAKMDQIKTARDMAQEQSRQLENANQELRQLDELKSNFLANVSHELKAPLVSTKGYVDFMLSGKMGPITEKQTKGLTVSRDNLHHLTRLINSLLDFSKMTSGTLKLHRQPCNVKELVESCIESVIPEAQRKNKHIEFSAEIPNDLPQIFADPDRIREVLLNLLLNAEKFTESGGAVKVAVHPPDPEHKTLSLSVSDNGIGIPEEHLSKVFQRFHQVDSSSTRKYGGTGLGLAIVNEIMEAHGCQIQVESTVGVGSKFTFTLPIHRVSSGPVARVAPERRGIHHPSKLVEVVEDDINIFGIVKTLLEEEGFSVIPARTGQDALAIAREHHPDLITLDVYLPDVNGFDLLSQLQSDPRTVDIPVIVVSIVMDKEKGFRLGAADYLEKPIDVEKLRSAMLRISDSIDESSFEKETGASQS